MLLRTQHDWGSLVIVGHASIEREGPYDIGWAILKENGTFPQLLCQQGGGVQTARVGGQRGQ